MLSIGAFSKVSNVTTNTLRYYDEIGLIKPYHVNTENGYRYYDIEQLNTILLINKLKTYFFSLEEISKILHEPHNNDLLLSIMKNKEIKITEDIDRFRFYLEQLKNDILTLERGTNIMSYLDKLEVKLVETQAKNILYIREKIAIADFGSYISRLYEKVAKGNYTVTGAPMSIYHDAEFKPVDYDVEVAMPVKEVTEDTRELAGSLCALIINNGPYSELTSVYSKLQQYIEENKYQILSSPYEIYMTDPNKTNPNDNITEVYFPIKK